MQLRYEEGNRYSCPLHYALTVIDGKWKPYLIWYLMPEAEPVEYARLRELVPYNISNKVFAQQLKELVADGMIERLICENPDSPEAPALSYRLTPTGRSLGGLLHLLSDWGYVNGPFEHGDGFKLVGRRDGNSRIRYGVNPPESDHPEPEEFMWLWNPRDAG